MSATAVLVTPWEAVIIQRIETSTQDIADMVGGALDLVDGGTKGWHAYIHLEQDTAGLMDNLLATTLAQALGWKGKTIRGPAVFLGDQDDDGFEYDVPVVVFNALRTVFTMAGRTW